MLVKVLFAFLIPCLIVSFWRKRPALALLSAGLVMFLSFIVPKLFDAFQTLSIYGEGDPQLMAGAISETIVGAILLMVFFLPLLWAFQWFILRRHRKKLSKKDVDRTVS